MDCRRREARLSCRRCPRVPQGFRTVKTIRVAVVAVAVLALMLAPVLCPTLVEAATRIRIHQPGPDVRVKIKRPARASVQIESGPVRAVWVGRRYADSCGG